MPPILFLIGELAHQIGLVPLLWLAGLHLRGQRRDAAWWRLAGAFFVSWLADSAVDLGAAPWVVSTVYPISQAALVGSVLLDREEATVLTIVLCFTGLAAVAWRGVEGPDVLLATVANLGAAGLAYRRRDVGRVRWSLLVAFGAGWACWMAYSAFPGWGAWLAYQSTRLAGACLFCWAATDTLPRFALSRRTV